MPSDVVDLNESPPDSPPDTPPARASMSSGHQTVARMQYQRPPIRDFALAGFQREKDLPALVAALREHDNQLRIFRMPSPGDLQPRIFKMPSPGGRITEITLQRLSSAPDLDHVRSEAGDSERTIKARKRDDAGEEGSGSETEKDEPGRSLAKAPALMSVQRPEKAGAAGDSDGVIEEDKGADQGKKKNKKKNKKKKKKSAGSDNKMDEAEVEELLDEDAVEDTEAKTKANETTDVIAEVDVELGGKPDSEPRPLDPVDEQDESLDETAQEDADAGDVSSSTIDHTLLVTPHLDSAPLPRMERTDSIIGMLGDEAAESKSAPTDVTVRLPSPTDSYPTQGSNTGPGEHTTSHAEASPCDQQGAAGEAPGNDGGDGVSGDGSGPVFGHQGDNTIASEDQRSVDSSIIAEVPLTPPYSPPTVDIAPIYLNHEAAAEASLQAQVLRPATPPLSPLFEPFQLPVVDIDEVRPLRRAWTLHHSFTGAATQIPNYGILNQSNAITPALGRQAAEDYSHGLFKLFTARIVQDYFGAWKALRRKIAIRRGRHLEPLDHPPAAGLQGLGIAFLPDDTNFHFFIEHVKPMWEDEACKRGGKIMITGNADDMDQLFFELILSLIGEQFVDAVPTPPSMTCTVVGAVLSKRRSTCRIEIWLGGREPLDAAWIRQIEQFVRNSFPGQNIFEYKAFHPSARPPRPRRDPNGLRSVSLGANAFGRGLGNAIGSGGR